MLDLKKLAKSEIRLIRDWKQFSWEYNGEDWVTPDEEYLDEFKTFISARTEVWPLSEVVDYVGELETRMYIQDLPFLKEMFRGNRR